MTARQAAGVPDTTGAVIALLRELRPGRVRKQVSSIVYWAYLAAILLLSYGGSLIADAARVLRRPPPPTAASVQVLHAAPGAVTALGLLMTLAILRDALWRGPVTVPEPTADWLLGTPVSRGRLLRPRFRVAVAVTVAVGAALGIVPAAILAEAGLGGSGGHELRLLSAAVTSAALLAAFGVGAAGLIERYPASWRGLRRATPVVAGAVAALSGLAAWAALGRPPALLSDLALWSGPWGWAGQGVVALAGGHAPLWPAATTLLGVLALVTLAAADRVAAGISAASLRTRARTIGAMSGALITMDSRSFALAYSSAVGASGRVRFRLRPPRRRELVIPWRDVLALARAPGRAAGAVAFALAGVGLAALAGSGGKSALLPTAGALSLGYLAAALLCEGCRLDGDDPRRSAHLPFRFRSLAWWHAVTPGVTLLVVAGVPVAALSWAVGSARPLALLAVTVPVLVAGGLVNAFRGLLPANVLAGIDTPLGNTALIGVVVWYAWGPALAIAPMTFLVSDALGAAPGALTRAVALGAGLAAGLGVFARARAERLRAS